MSTEQLDPFDPQTDIETAAKCSEELFNYGPIAHEPLTLEMAMQIILASIQKISEPLRKEYNHERERLHNGTKERDAYAKVLDEMACVSTHLSVEIAREAAQEVRTRFNQQQQAPEKKLVETVQGCHAIIRRLESTLHVIATNQYYHENSEQNAQTAAQWALDFLEEKRRGL